MLYGTHDFDEIIMQLISDIYILFCLLYLKKWVCFKYIYLISITVVRAMHCLPYYAVKPLCPNFRILREMIL